MTVEKTMLNIYKRFFFASTTMCYNNKNGNYGETTDVTIPCGFQQVSIFGKPLFSPSEHSLHLPPNHDFLLNVSPDLGNSDLNKSPFRLVCRKRPLNGAVLGTRQQNTEVPCYCRRGTMN